jgi:hypothetical protein
LYRGEWGRKKGFGREGKNEC